MVAAFPEFDVLEMTVAGRGWDSLAIEIDRRLIAKFPKNAQAETALRREARLLAALRPHVRMPVPAMSLHEGEQPFSLHGKLPGRRLDRDDYLRLTEARRQALADDLARFFADLHAISPEAMRAAGAEPVEWWDTRPATLDPVWKALGQEERAVAWAAIDEYRLVTFDKGRFVYGFFDAHGWNMAFDHERGRLNGIYDFADSGFGPPEREFTQVSLTHPELAARSIAAYERLSGRPIDRRLVFLLSAAMRLSEFAGALETGENLDLVRGFALDWFRQRDVR